MQDEQRANLFRRAIARHVQYAAWAADGQGVDRHLFGLKKMVREGEPLPEIYKDEAFAKTSHWELSTSQLSSPFIDGWGYGEGERGVSLFFGPGADPTDGQLFLMATGSRTQLGTSTYGGRSRASSGTRRC